MMLGSFYFKQRARDALRGNWQTALVVTFFAGALLTLASVMQTLWLPDPLTYAMSGEYAGFYAALEKVPMIRWLPLTIVNVLATVLSPALALSCDRYFLKRLQGEDVGVKEGLLSRMPIWGRALWLRLVMVVRIGLWSLLLVAPGIIAAIRYSMAPYFMAQDPELTATEAIEKSKHVMQNLKMSYFSLVLSFIGWMLLANVAEMLLMGMSMVVALVAAQFMQLAISTYMNGAVAAFFEAVSSPDGMRAARRMMRERLRQMGMDDQAIAQAGFGEAPEPSEDDADEGHDPQAPHGEGGELD